MKALRVEKEFGRSVLTELRNNGWLDTTRRILRDTTSIELPLVQSTTKSMLIKKLPEEARAGCQIINQTNPKYKKQLKSPIDLILEQCRIELNLDQAKLNLLPQKWELLGKVLILRLDQKLKRYWHSISKVYARVLGAKTVLRRSDKIRGVFRKPGVELIFGRIINTVHIENKVKFKFNPMKVMFSSGNIDERIRISSIPKKSETIVDMFAGIGYLSLPIAVHRRPTKIIACELNPLAYKYLCENIKLNHVEEIVEPILGDNRKNIQHNIADRVIMGYIKSDQSHLEAAFQILKSAGGIVHYHDVGFKSEIVTSTFGKVQEALVNTGFATKLKPELVNHYLIKSYGPKLVHVVLDIRFTQVR